MAFDSRDHMALLAEPQKNIKPPPALPSGHYYGQIMRYEIAPPRWDPNVQALFYHVQLTEPGPDVDPTLLDGVNLRDRQLNPIAYPITPDRLIAIKRLHESMGLSQENSTDANIPESIGRRVLVNINQTASNREGDDRVFNNITSMVGVKD